MALKVHDVLHEVDLMRPNAVDKTLKMKFLNEIEAEVFDLSLEFLPAEEILKNNVQSRAYFWQKKAENPGSGNTSSTVPVSVSAAGGMALPDPLNMGKDHTDLLSVWKFIPYDDTEGDAVMLLDERFSGVYTSYIKAKIDFLEDETEDYANDSQMHAAEKNAWVAWMTKTHMHRQPIVRGLL